MRRQYSFTKQIERGILFLIVLSVVCLCPLTIQSKSGHDEFTGRRDFRGLVRRDMAFTAAELAAEITAYEHAVRLLGKEPDLHFAISPPSSKSPLPKPQNAVYTSGRLPLEGIAGLMYAVRTEGKTTEGFPPNITAVVHARLLMPENLRKALQEILARPEMVRIYNALLVNKRALLQRYDLLAAPLLPLRPSDEGGMDLQYELQSVCNEISGLKIYEALLPTYELHWKNPEAAYTKLESAEKLAPKNPLVLTAIAEALLQLDRPLPALERVTEALKLSAELPRAHDVRGAILLRQRLPVLAAESFTKAIELSPDISAYYMHRASAYLILEQEADMCQDFKTACGMGECEGLQWALDTGKCGKTNR